MHRGLLLVATIAGALVVFASLVGLLASGSVCHALHLRFCRADYDAAPRRTPPASTPALTPNPPLLPFPPQARRLIINVGSWRDPVRGPDFQGFLLGLIRLV